MSNIKTEPVQEVTSEDEYRKLVQQAFGKMKEKR